MNRDEGHVRRNCKVVVGVSSVNIIRVFRKKYNIINDGIADISVRFVLHLQKIICCE